MRAGGRRERQAHMQDEVMALVHVLTLCHTGTERRTKRLTKAEVVCDRTSRR